VKLNWLTVALGLVAGVAAAQDRVELSREQLAAEFPGVDPNDVLEAALPGMYEVAIGSSVAYVTKDGRYVLQGDLYDLDENANLTEERRARARVDMLAGVDPETMIVFKPESGETKHTITIFTDIDCGYCRQFHREISQVLDQGVEVHYLSFPRTGPDTDSWYKAEMVWCAEDRNTALTEAKLGGRVPEDACPANPVDSHYNLGNLVGVRGTPAVFSADGRELGGYLTPDQLMELLEQ
jgi:thiol:disulfide interchange protein DsbC